MNRDKDKANHKNAFLNLIPAGWEEKSIEDLGDVKRGAGSQYLKYIDDGVRLIRINDFFENNPVFIQSFEGIERFSLSDQDILFAGTGASAGSAFIPPVDWIGLPHSYNAPRIRLHNKADKNFIFQCLQACYVHKQQHEAFVGAAQPFLDTTAISNLKIKYPPEKERNRISAILSQWDKCISMTQALIDQIKLRNKGLAQQLLTGRKRLKGFEGEWKMMRAEKIFRNHSDKTHGGSLEVLSATQEQGVVPRSMVNIDIKYDENSLDTYKKVDEGDFVISLRSFQGGIEYSKYSGIVSPAYTILKEIIPVSKTFYKIYFKTQTFINELNTIIYGIRDGKQISYNEFCTLSLPCPSVEEQHAIADVLECADKELTTIFRKLENLKDQKKGLMQKLLTGEIRVKT